MKILPTAVPCQYYQQLSPVNKTNSHVNHTNSFPLSILPIYVPYQSYQQLPLSKILTVVHSQSYQQLSHVNLTNICPMSIIPRAVPCQPYQQLSPVNITNSCTLSIIPTISFQYCNVNSNIQHFSLNKCFN